MNFKIINKSDLELSKIKPFLSSFLPFAKKKMGFDRPPSISFVSDQENASKILGKTAYYDPNNESVVVYTDGRHPKDMLRSISHELIHHTQNCQGNFNQRPNVGEGYFQEDEYMQEMEREAYEKGNMCFREWEETHKKQLEESIYYNTGDTKMKLNEWKNQELFSRLLENFGYNAPKVTEEVVEEAEEALEEAEELEEGEKVVEEAEENIEEIYSHRNTHPDVIEETAELEEGEEVVEEATDLEEGEEVVKEAEELEEITLPGTAAAGMDAAIAELEREELEALKAKVEAYLASMPPATGETGARAATSRLPAAKSPFAVGLEESKIREAVRKAVKKVLNK
jgi:hypothetical protein